ncbi:sodium/substrate symporter small subunit [Streptomyces aidingensis]|uniref:Putative solute:sodium symporter small subunit n=1 Tax=Streptomyces aidingensis TaxID=910347 RepID=A0A1I1EAW9_9ACTN|nr:sodium/substrate symporter small subunit [Streptomyces aidingensis]SFB82508.1 putative solute:sodium symporter small subunit [Streptomyces aidingensis]
MTSPRRVRVTSPQTRIALSRRHRPAQHLLPPPDGDAADRRADAEARKVFVRQRRLAVRTLVLLIALLFGLSGILAVSPGLDRVTLFGAPVSWLMLMTGSYPVLLVIAFLHVRAAERIEDGSSWHFRESGPGPFSGGPAGDRPAAPGRGQRGAVR